MLTPCGPEFFTVPMAWGSVETLREVSAIQKYSDTCYLLRAMVLSALLPEFFHSFKGLRIGCNSSMGVEGWATKNNWAAQLRYLPHVMIMNAVDSGTVHSVNRPSISEIGSMRGKCHCTSSSDQLVLTPCHGPGQSKRLEGPFYWRLAKVNEMVRWTSYCSVGVSNPEWAGGSDVAKLEEALGITINAIENNTGQRLLSHVGRLITNQ